MGGGVGKGAEVYKVRGKVNGKLLREMAGTNDVAETIERKNCNHCRDDWIFCRGQETILERRPKTCERKGVPQERARNLEEMAETFWRGLETCYRAGNY